MNLRAIADTLYNQRKNIILIFAFNGTGKTRLSVEYKNLTKEKNNNQHSGVYYNSYSEDLFVWDNDPNNEGKPVCLNITKSTLNGYHSYLQEDNIRNYLSIYNPKYNFRFKSHDDSADGLANIVFYAKKGNEIDYDTQIKISRGEERIFIWCFFLALFAVQEEQDGAKTHFFIDDPVSSLDDHRIFLTASTVMDLIEKHFEQRKIIITTHHLGFFALLHNWLARGEKAARYRNHITSYILKGKEDDLKLVSIEKDVFLYHLELMQILKKAVETEELYTYHFALLRQVLENIASFLGTGRMGHVLEQIGIDDVGLVSNITNTLTHKDVFKYETNILEPDNVRVFKIVFNKIQEKYNFVLHEGDAQ